MQLVHVVMLGTSGGNFFGSGNISIPPWMYTHNSLLTSVLISKDKPSFSLTRTLKFCSKGPMSGALKRENNECVCIVHCTHISTYYAYNALTQRNVFHLSADIAPNSNILFICTEH